MTVKRNILGLQQHYVECYNQAKHKAELIFPLRDKERQLRLSYIDEARIYSQIAKILQIPNIDNMFKAIELQLKNTSVNKYRQELKKLQKKLFADLIPDEDCVGITELSDPSNNQSWIDRLKPKANIIITKNLAPISNIILANKHRIILHVTCTGFGSTKLEPNVPPAPIQIIATKNLIEAGFPVNQIVLRLDPIIFIGNIRDVMLHDTVMQYFADLGVTRCRYSFLDQYEHVKQNFSKLGIQPTIGFTYPKYQIELHSKHLQEKWGSIFHLEACCEETIHQQACISQMDIDILKKNAGINHADLVGLSNIQLVGSKASRKNCKCPLNKFELIRDIPGKCSLNCQYCYWKKNE